MIFYENQKVTEKQQVAKDQQEPKDQQETKNKSAKKNVNFNLIKKLYHAQKNHKFKDIFWKIY